MSQDPFNRCLAGNQIYKHRVAEDSPDFFPTLATGQKPEILWIGCADSRVPETTICDCKPGDIFVHRNIANILKADDTSAASVIEYGVSFVKVQQVIVCGHTSCGGANAALGDADLGETLNTWLVPLRELRRKNKAELEKLPTDGAKANRLAELNVQQSIEVLKQHPAVSKAIRERGLTVHGVIYDIAVGELKPLDDSQQPSSGLWSQTR